MADPVEQTTSIIVAVVGGLILITALTFRLLGSALSRETQEKLLVGQRELADGQREIIAVVKENTAVQRDANALLKELLGILNSGQAAGGARTGADG